MTLSAHCALGFVALQSSSNDTINRSLLDILSSADKQEPRATKSIPLSGFWHYANAKFAQARRE